MCIGGDETGSKIKDQKPEMSESVFYVVAEDPEIEHIAPEMKKTAVKEHGGEDGGNRMDRLGLLEGQKVMGNRTVMVNHFLLPCGR